MFEHAGEVDAHPLEERLGILIFQRLGSRLIGVGQQLDGMGLVRGALEDLPGPFECGPEEFKLLAGIVNPVGSSLRLVENCFLVCVLLLGAGGTDGAIQANDRHIEIRWQFRQGILGVTQGLFVDGDGLGLVIDGGLELGRGRVRLLEEFQFDLKSG